MAQIIEAHRDAYTISTDPARIDINAVYDFLSRAYWANTRPREMTDKAFSNSLVFGIYEGQKQVGIARVVTDFSVFAYLCDVFIHEDHRSQGLGKWLMQTVTEHPDLKHVRRFLLVTNDAHGLYQQFGFSQIEEPHKWMHLVRPFPGE